MKIIETNGIQFIELLAEKSSWYCGTDYACGDLYEAEEVFLEKGAVRHNRLIFIKNFDGKLVEPILLEDNQYFGRPTEIDGRIYILLVDFGKQQIQVFDCGSEFEKIATYVEIPLSEVEDCYNLLLMGDPLMLTRQGGDNIFQVIWPKKILFPIGDTESFLYRVGDDFYFSRWKEEPDYSEEVVVRDRTGKIISVTQGNIFITPAGEKWLLK